MYFLAFSSKETIQAWVHLRLLAPLHTWTLVTIENCSVKFFHTFRGFNRKLIHLSVAFVMVQGYSVS